MESRTTLYGPMLAIIALSLVATSGIPLPTETRDSDDISGRDASGQANISSRDAAVTTWPQLLRDRAIALAAAL